MSLEPEQTYTILASKWWTTNMLYLPPYNIGAVAIQSGRDGKNWKAYIGHVPGNNRPFDEQVVAAFGAKLSKEEAAGLFPDLDIKEYAE